MHLSSKDNDPVLLFTLRLHLLGVASVFFPLLQGRWHKDGYELSCTNTFKFLLCWDTVRHLFEPFPSLTKKINNFIHVFAMNVKRENFSWILSESI